MKFEVKKIKLLRSVFFTLHVVKGDELQLIKLF